MKRRKMLLSEDKLIEAMNNKSRIGAMAFYDMYAKTLYGFIIKIIRDKEMAEDACQDSLIKIWNSFDRYEASKGRLFTWMLAITRNVARDTLSSKQYRQHLYTEPFEFHADMVANRDYLVPNVDAIGVTDWIDSLKKDQKDILHLIYRKGYTHSEAATELQIPLGTVKTRCRGGINVLRGVYKDLNITPIEIAL